MLTPALSLTGRGDSGQVISPLWASVFLTVKWRLKLDDRKAPCRSEDAGALSISMEPKQQAGFLSTVTPESQILLEGCCEPTHTQPAMQGLVPPPRLQEGVS